MHALHEKIYKFHWEEKERCEVACWLLSGVTAAPYDVHHIVLHLKFEESIE